MEKLQLRRDSNLILIGLLQSLKWWPSLSSVVFRQIAGSHPPWCSSDQRWSNASVVQQDSGADRMFSRMGSCFYRKIGAENSKLPVLEPGDAADVLLLGVYAGEVLGRKLHSAEVVCGTNTILEILGQKAQQFDHFSHFLWDNAGRTGWFILGRTTSCGPLLRPWYYGTQPGRKGMAVLCGCCGLFSIFSFPSLWRLITARWFQHVSLVRGTGRNWLTSLLEKAALCPCSPWWSIPKVMSKSFTRPCNWAVWMRGGSEKLAGSATTCCPCLFQNRRLMLLGDGWQALGWRRFLSLIIPTTSGKIYHPETVSGWDRYLLF